MAELEMKEYEQLGRKKENTYDEIKVDKRKKKCSASYNNVFVFGRDSIDSNLFYGLW